MSISTPDIWLPASTEDTPADMLITDLSERQNAPGAPVTGEKHAAAAQSVQELDILQHLEIPGPEAVKASSEPIEIKISLELGDGSEPPFLPYVSPRAFRHPVP